VILAVTHAGDDHAPLVLDALARRGAEVVVLDLADLPRTGRLALSYGYAGRVREVRVDGRPPIRAEEVTAVWWRRPRPFAANAGLRPDDAAFSARQVGGAVMGLLATLGASGVRLVNDPWRDEVASLKTHQLAAAERAGLAVPPTLVTSDPDAARAFLGACGPGGAVHKQLHATAEAWRPTRRVGPDELARLDALRYAPVILQAFVPGVDVRVTAVGDELFAAEIDARATASPEDFRPVLADCRVAPCALPERDSDALRALLRDLDLSYAAIDLRRREDGSLAFLEVNPGGQWYFVEQRTGQPITAALASLLASRRQGATD
jgi:glutathione synthase/RimK-type ligase-like ATP-grasp enzyme